MANIQRVGQQQIDRSRFDTNELRQLEHIEETALQKVMGNGFALAIVFLVFVVMLLIIVSFFAVEIAKGLSVVQSVLGFVVLVIIVFNVPKFFRWVGIIYEDYKITQNTELINSFFYRLLGFLTVGLSILTFFTALNVSIIVYSYKAISEGGNPVKEIITTIHGAGMAPKK